MKPFLLLIGYTLSSLVVAHAACAGTFHQGWTYSIDAADDGVGGDGYEIQGLAIKETQNHVYISISGDSLLTGISSTEADDGNVGWGDLLFNFTNDTINTANGSLLGIRFADTNDSGVNQVGVYGNVTAQSVTQQNAGYDSLQHYYAGGWERPNTMGDMVTAQDAYDYMGTTDPVLTSIAEGTFLGDIEFLEQSNAIAADLDFSYFNVTSTETHTFRFDRTLLPGGDFIATLLMECANDGIALLGRLTDHSNNAQDVPESSPMVSVLVIGLFATLIYRDCS